MKLKGLKNLRDVGGVRTADGKVVREGLMYRSDSLHAITKEDASVLSSELGIQTIMDLRTDLEVSERPDILPKGVEYLHIPVFNESVIGISKETGSDIGTYIKHSWGPGTVRKSLPDMEKIYREVMLSPDIQKQLSLSLKTIMKSVVEGRPILFHCSQGKDRTGSLCALLHSILGVDRKTVIKEYVAGGRVYAHKGILDAVLVSIVKLAPLSAYKVFSSSVAKRSFIEATLDTIDSNFGSVESLFVDVFGISQDMISDFKATVLS